jgi:hypothetical protein
VNDEAIFVFGSNLSGRHGKGAALHAREHYGAMSGKGVGLQGRSYAIPTKDHGLRALPLDQIAHYVKKFIEFATEHSEMTFQVTRVGCGMAGYSDKQVAPLFASAPKNCRLPEEWQPFLRTIKGQKNSKKKGEE